MIPSAITLKVFGIPMQRRSTRRKLVVATYIVLSSICAAAAWSHTIFPAGMTYAIWSAIAVGIFIFGGQGRYGLVKPFLNKPPQPEPPMIDLVRLQLEPLSVGTADSSAWKNDERELARRDNAHYVAYQPLAIGWVAVLMLSSWALHAPRFLSHDAILSLIFTIALVACVLALTLPAAIILWTEPDIDVC